MYIDTNVFLYALLNQDRKGGEYRDFLRKVEAGKYNCTTSCLVLDEVAWVVRKHRDSKTAIRAWKDILCLPIKILPIDEKVAFRVPYFMEKYNLKPRDAIHASVMMENGINQIVSDDSDFKKVKEIKVKKIEDGL